MACLSCPCSNSSSPAPTGQDVGSQKEVHLEQQLGELNRQQLRSLCSLNNLQWQGPKETLIGRLSSEVNNNAYVDYFLQQEQQMKNKEMSDDARKQMRTNLLNQVEHIKHAKQSQNSAAIPGGKNLTEEIDVLKQKLQKVKHTKHVKQSQNSAEVVKRVKEHLTAIPGGKSLTEKIDVLKQKLQKVSSGVPQTNLISNAVEVSKKVEERLARMEARLEVERDNTELKKKANLVKNKLQRCYFLMQLLPLSKNRMNYFAFVLKCKEQRKNEKWSRLEQTQTERQTEVEDPLSSSHATGPGFKLLREETTSWGISRKLVLLSDEALRRFCRWKGGWSNSKDYVEKRSGARLELRPAGELLIEGTTVNAVKAKNTIQGYLGSFKHSL